MNIVTTALHKRIMMWAFKIAKFISIFIGNGSHELWTWAPALRKQQVWVG